MKKAISVSGIIILIMIIFTLSACGQGNDGETGATDGSTGAASDITAPSYQSNMSDAMKNSIIGNWTVTINEVNFIYSFGESSGTIKIGEDTESINPFYSSDNEFVWKVSNRESYFAYNPKIQDGKLVLTPLYSIKDGQKYVDGSGKDMVLTKAD